MASKAAKGQRRHRAIVGAPRVPRSFEEALTKGWRIHEQLSSWSFKRANKREGFLVLTKGNAVKTLTVRYTALYELGEPYFLEVKS